MLEETEDHPEAKLEKIEVHLLWERYLRSQGQGMLAVVVGRLPSLNNQKRRMLPRLP